MVRPSGHGRKVCLLIGFLLSTKVLGFREHRTQNIFSNDKLLLSLCFIPPRQEAMFRTLFFFPQEIFFSSKNLPQAAESILFSPKPPQLRVRFPFCQGQSLPMERLVFVTSDWGAMVQAGDVWPCVVTGSGEPIGQEPRKFEGSSRIRKKRGPQTPHFCPLCTSHSQGQEMDPCFIRRRNYC